jgi:hypothetical protein
MTEKDLYLAAIQGDPNNARPYNNLAALLQSNDTVTLLDGRKLAKKQLYVEAIRCDQKYTAAYINLASELRANEVVTLANGLVANKKELYKEAFKNDPSSQAFLKLAKALSLHDVEELPGISFNQQGDYIGDSTFVL